MCLLLNDDVEHDNHYLELGDINQKIFNYKKLHSDEYPILHLNKSCMAIWYIFCRIAKAHQHKIMIMSIVTGKCLAVSVNHTRGNTRQPDDMFEALLIALQSPVYECVAAQAKPHCVRIISMQAI